MGPEGAVSKETEQIRRACPMKSLCVLSKGLWPRRRGQRGAVAQICVSHR